MGGPGAALSSLGLVPGVRSLVHALSIGLSVAGGRSFSRVGPPGLRVDAPPGRARSVVRGRRTKPFPGLVTPVKLKERVLVSNAMGRGPRRGWDRGRAALGICHGP